MKTPVQIVLVAVTVGGLSFAATQYLKPSPLATAAVDAADETPAADVSEPEASPTDDPDEDPAEAAPTEAVPPPEPAAVAESSHADVEHAPPAATVAVPAAPAIPAPPVAVRPPYSPEGDEAGDLINLLRERSRKAAVAQQRLAERQDAMQLIFDDLRSEQARLSGVRKRLADELKVAQITLEVSRQAVDDERAALKAEQAQTQRAAADAIRAANEERDRLRQQLEQPDPKNAPADSAASPGPESPEDNANLKRMAAVFDSMSAENVARVVEQLVKNKRTDAVVALLNAMKERQSAKVLGVITESDPALAADLTDRLKKYKAAPASP